MSVEQKINELRQRLNYLNHMYYVEAKPVATDYEFDPTMGRMYYFYHDAERYWKEIWPVRRKG